MNWQLVIDHTCNGRVESELKRYLHTRRKSVPVWLNGGVTMVPRKAIIEYLRGKRDNPNAPLP